MHDGMMMGQKSWLHLLLAMVLGATFFYFLVQGYVYQNSGAFDAFTVWVQYFIALLALLFAKWSKWHAWGGKWEMPMMMEKKGRK